MKEYKEYIETGKIVSTHGLTGEVRAEAWCDTPQFLAGLEELHVGSVGNRMRVLRGRVQKNVVLLQLEGVEDIDAAVALRGKVLYIHRGCIPLEEGEYLIQDLVGCKVFDGDTGEEYGILCDVSATGANDIYHVRFADGSVKLVPVIPQVILHVDVAGGRVDIRPLKGLFEA